MSSPNRFNPLSILLLGLLSWVVIILAAVVATGCATTRTVNMTPLSVEATAVTAELDYENVVVVYEADWCPACRYVDGLLPEKLKGREESLKIVRVDVDKSEEKDLPAGMQGIPYFVVYKDGKKTFEGNVDNEEEFDNLFK